MKTFLYRTYIALFTLLGLLSMSLAMADGGLAAALFVGFIFYALHRLAVWLFGAKA